MVFIIDTQSIFFFCARESINSLMSLFLIIHWNSLMTLASFSSPWWNSKCTSLLKTEWQIRSMETVPSSGGKQCLERRELIESGVLVIQLLVGLLRRQFYLAPAYSSTHRPWGSEQPEDIMYYLYARRNKWTWASSRHRAYEQNESRRTWVIQRFEYYLGQKYIGKIINISLIQSMTQEQYWNMIYMYF